MIDNFDEWVEKILEEEGGFVDLEDDKGGATNLGVTIPILEQFRQANCDRDDIEDLTPAEAKEIYKELFWDKARLDELPADIRSYYADMTVNMGHGGAGKILQMSCNTKQFPNEDEKWISVDGMVGPNTIRAVGTAGIDLIDVVCERLVFLVNNILAGSRYGKRTRQNRFIRGWIRRAIRPFLEAWQQVNNG